MGWRRKQKIQGVHLTAHLDTWEPRRTSGEEGFPQTERICWDKRRQSMQKPPPKNDSEIQIDRQDFIVSAISWRPFLMHSQGLINLSHSSTYSNRVVSTIKRSSRRNLPFIKRERIIRCYVQKWRLQSLH